jgi:hypothetical protein
MFDEPPLIEDHSNSTKLVSTPVQLVRRLRVWCEKDEPIPLVSGVGIRGIRLPIQLSILDAYGKIT